MFPMLKFPNSSSEKPGFRLLLPYEVTQNREILPPAIRYLQSHARIDLAIILLQASLAQYSPRLVRTVRELGLEHVFVDKTTADYYGGGKIRIPITEMRRMVLLSQRRIALDHDDKREIPPSRYEFAQACGKDPPITRNDPCRRYESVEMVSGFSSTQGQRVCDSVPKLIDAIGKASWAQRVTKEQLTTPEETGRLFGYHDEQPEEN
ncbi:MAG: hypothetical protein PHX93_02225 [Candidatus Peribacteraceae bacterium]|jgi:hypothetical protein|nr:hypothetical protein [Candidatus Peribacteraceae bacterium]